MEGPIVNRVAKSGIITINLEDYFPETPIVEFDLKAYLFQELILKEKDFREAMKEHDWTQYQGKILAVYCSADAIIPVWAFMLVSAYAQPEAEEVFFGTKEAYLSAYYKRVIESLDTSDWERQRIVMVLHSMPNSGLYAFFMRRWDSTFLHGRPGSLQ